MSSSNKIESMLLDAVERGSSYDNPRDLKANSGTSRITRTESFNK
jgi:hypothetical protein